MQYVSGDILDFPHGIICQVVNPDGVMGAGLARQIAKRWPWVESAYKQKLAETDNNINLYVGVEKPDLFVCCMFAMASLQTPMPRFRYFKFVDSLRGLNGWRLTMFGLKPNEVDPARPVLFPYGIGCGLAGGDWPLTEKLIAEIIPAATIVKYEQGRNL